MEKVTDNEPEGVIPEGRQDEGVSDVPFYYRIDLGRMTQPPKEAPPPPEQSRQLDNIISRVIGVYGFVFVTMLSIAVMALMMIKYKILADRSALVSFSVELAIPTTILFWILVFFLVGWKKGLRKHLILPILSAPALMFYAAFFGTTAINGLLDNSPTADRIAMVSDKFMARGASNTTPDYFIRIKTWAPEGEDLELKIDEWFYNSIQPGVSRVHMKTRAGWLGHEWVESMSPALE